MLKIKPHVKGGTLLMDVRIVAMRRLNSTVNGNPRFVVTTENDGALYTMSDASDAYHLENYAVNGVPLCLELTRAGRIRHAVPMAELHTYYATKES
jgi:hypothetical protein